MWCGYVDDIDIWIFDELMVGTICFGGAGGLDLGEECGCAVFGGGAGCCCDDMLDV